MLNKSYRIPKDKILDIIRRGKKAYVKSSTNEDLLTIAKWYENELERPQFAFVVSKKVDNRAVIRNRIKRRLRAVIYHILEGNTLRPGSYVLIAKSKEVGTMEFARLQEMISDNV